MNHFLSEEMGVGNNKTMEHVNLWEIFLFKYTLMLGISKVPGEPKTDDTFWKRNVPFRSWNIWWDIHLSFQGCESSEKKWGTKNTNAEEAPPSRCCEFLCRNLSVSTTFQKSHEPEIGCFYPPKTRDPLRENDILRLYRVMSFFFDVCFHWFLI